MAVVATAHSECSPTVTLHGPPLTEQQDALGRHAFDSIGSHVCFSPSMRKAVHLHEGGSLLLRRERTHL